MTLQGAYYLVSHHNTVVYVDEDSKRLRHAPLGTARLNFLLELSGDRAQLMVTEGSPSERLSASFGRETDEIRVHAGASDLACVIERLPGDEIAIRIGELYITADGDGVVRNNRNWCREWERFHLVSADAARPDETATREREKISGFVISYNRAAIIETCLRSLRFVDELVVVDKSSTDGTLEIARRYADKVVVVPWTPTADDTRSYAVDLCSHDMIVYLDDDECLSPEAIKFILDESANPSAEVYRLPFRSYFLGRFDKRRRDWPEYHERLFRRGALEFSPTIHSNIMVKSSKVLTIPAESPIFVHHLSCASVDQWLEKILRYTSQPARASWYQKSTALSAELVHRQTDYWFHNQEGVQNDDVAAYALMHVVYDLIDRLKQWESEAGIDGDKAFAEICRGLQTDYDELEQELGRHAPMNQARKFGDLAGIAPDQVDAGNPIPSVHFLPNANVCDAASGRFLLFESPDVIGQTIRSEGRWDASTQAIASLFLDRAAADGTIVDAGANLGAFTIPIAKGAGQRFKVLSFEVQRVVFYQLCGNVILNSLGNVFPQNIGLSDFAARISIPVPDYCRDFNIGGLSIDPEIRRRRGLTGLHAPTDFQHDRLETVEVNTLDSFGLSDVRLLKLDVEGVELQLLRGAYETIRTSGYPPIIFESWDQRIVPSLSHQRVAILAYLDDLGYEVDLFGETGIAQHRSHGDARVSRTSLAAAAEGGKL